MKKLISRGAAACSALLLPVVAFAEDATGFNIPDMGVNAGDVTNGIAGRVGPWLLAGLGVAVGVWLVRLGYRTFRGFIGH